MIESLMTDLMAGAARGVADSFAKGGTQTSLADTSFAKVFDSIQQNDQMAKQQEVIAKPVAKEKSDDRSDDDRAMKADKPEKVEADDRQENKSDDEPTLSSDAIAAKIMARLDKMKAEDPEAFAALMDQAGQMNMQDFLTQLGFTQDEIGQFADAMNLNVAVSEEMANGMAQGDLQQVAQSVGAMVNKEDASKIDNVKGNAELVRPAEKVEQVKAPVVDVKRDDARQETNTSKQETGATRTDASRQQANADASKNDQGQTGAEGKKEARPEGMVSSLADTESRAAMKEAALEASKEHGAAKTVAAKTENVATPQASATAEQAAAKLAAPAAQAAQADKAAVASAPKTSAPTVDANGAANASTKSDVVSAEAADKADRPANTQRRDFERMLMAQVVDKARVGFKANGASQMTMRLDPPQLGKIDMRIMVQDNSVKAVMVAENAEVKAAIEGNIEQLKQQLANAGMKVDELTVNTAADRQGLAFGQTQTDGRNGAHTRGSSRNGSTGATGEAEEINATPQKDPRHNGLLSIVA